MTLPHHNGRLRTLRRWALFAGVLATLLAAVPTVAHAADSDDPEKLIKRGNDLRRQGDNIRAFGYLQRAHELVGTPRTAAQLGLCEQALGRFADAETHLTAALSTNDAWVDANRAGLESSRSVVRQKLGKVQITGAPPGTTVAVGAAAAHRLPSDGAVWVAPGAVAVTLEAPGFRSATRTSNVSEGGSTTIAAAMASVATGSPGPASATTSTAVAVVTDPGQPLTNKNASGVASAQGTTDDSPAAGAESHDDGNAGLRITGLAVAGGGVALVVGGFVLWRMASSKAAAIDADAKAGRPYNPDNDNWKTLDRSGITLMAVGGAAVATGAVLYLMNRGGDAPSATNTASLSGRSLANRLSVAWTPDQGLRLGYAASF